MINLMAKKINFKFAVPDKRRGVKVFLGRKI